MDYLELREQTGETFQDSLETAKKTQMNVEEKKEMIQTIEKEQEMHKELLNRQKKEMDSIKTEIESLLTVKESDNEENLNALAGIYESMKPSEVALLAQNIDEKLLAKILVRMKTRKAAKVMDEITKTDPQKSASITDNIMKLKLEE